MPIEARVCRLKIVQQELSSLKAEVGEIVGRDRIHFGGCGGEDVFFQEYNTFLLIVFKIRDMVFLRPLQRFRIKVDAPYFVLVVFLDPGTSK